MDAYVIENLTLSVEHQDLNNNCYALCYEGLNLRMLSRVERGASTEALSSLLEAGASVNFSRPLDERTAVHIASQKGFQELLSFLISRGGNVNVHGVDLITPLHEAALHDNPECVAILIKAGAQVCSQRLFYIGLSTRV